MAIWNPLLHRTRFVRAHMKNLALWAPCSLLYITLKRCGYDRVWPGMYLVALIFLLLLGACVSQALDTLLLSCPLFFLPTNILHENIIGEFSTQSALNNSVSKLMIKLRSPDTWNSQRTSWSLLFWCGCSFGCHLYVWWILLLWHD